MIPQTDMLFEIRVQPGMLKRVCEQANAFFNPLADELRKAASIRFVGCGDMDFSARTCAGLAPRGSTPSAIAHRSMDMRWEASGLGEGHIVIVASFSGRTPRTLEAAMLARKAGATVIGITGNEESPLGQALDRVLVLDTGPVEELVRHDYAGYHFNVPQTRTFTAMLMAELECARAAGLLNDEDAKDLETIPGQLETMLPKLEEIVSAFMDKGFREVERVSVLGSGPWQGLAAYGAAKFLEMAIPARYQCIEENNHLEMFVTQKEDLILFFAPDARSLSRAEELWEPYARFDTLRVAIVPAEAKDEEPSYRMGDEGVHILSLPGGSRISRVFSSALLLQLLPAAIGPAIGRDINQWVGGVRTELIETMGHECVRGSQIRGEF